MLPNSNSTFNSVKVYKREKKGRENMKKVISALLSICMFTMILTGCGTKNKDEGNEATGTRTIVDHLGETVEIPAKIERVAIVDLLPLPSVLAAYQGGNVDNLVAMPPDSLNAAKNSILSVYAPDILNVSTECFAGGETNMEELLKLEPDVILYSGATNTEIFKAAGVLAVCFSPTAAGPNTIETLGKWIELLEEVFNKKSKVTGIVEYGRKAEEEINKRLESLSEDEKVNVLMINQYTASNLMVAGKGTFGEYWCNATSSNNVALAAEKNSVNMEQVYQWNPDKIFLSTLTSFMPRDLYENTAGTGHDWSTVKAVEEKEVYKFPLGMHRWWPPSTDAPLSLWWIAKKTYPQLFEDINMEEMTKDYYKEFYGMELSDEDIEWIFNPRENLGRTSK